MNEEIFPHSLARIRVEELKKDLIERVKREFLDFHMSFPESKFTLSLLSYS